MSFESKLIKQGRCPVTNCYGRLAPGKVIRASIKDSRIGVVHTCMKCKRCGHTENISPARKAK